MPSARNPVASRQAQRYETEVPLRLEHGKGVVRNVSASGIYFVTDAPLEKDKPMKLTFEFTSLPNGAIHVSCLARVLRLEEGHGGMTGVAASIDNFEFFRLPVAAARAAGAAQRGDE